MLRIFFHLLRKGGAKTFQTMGFIVFFIWCADCRGGYHPPAFFCALIDCFFELVCVKSFFHLLKKGGAKTFQTMGLDLFFLLCALIDWCL